MARLVHDSGAARRARAYVVLAAVDLDTEEAETGLKVLATADALVARSTGQRAVLHVVHAWRLIGESILSCPVRGLRPETYRRLIKEVGVERATRVESMAAEVLGAPAEGLHVIHGDPRSVVPEVAQRIGADLIVLGARRSHGLTRRLVEGVADAVSDLTSCPIVVVRGPSPSEGAKPVAPIALRSAWRNRLHHPAAWQGLL